MVVGRLEEMFERLDAVPDGFRLAPSRVGRICLNSHLVPKRQKP